MGKHECMGAILPNIANPDHLSNPLLLQREKHQKYSIFIPLSSQKQYLGWCAPVVELWCIYKTLEM